MASFGLYSHIQANRRRSVLLLIGLFFLIYVLTYAGAIVAEVVIDSGAPLDHYLRTAWRDLKFAWPFATVGTLLWIAIAYKFHQSMIDRMTASDDVTREQEPRLYNLLENLCISRGIAMPKLKIAEDRALNAFATGLNQRQYSITVTRGLIETLNDAETEAVLGHELTHIRNGDVRMLVIALVIAGVVSFFGEMIFRTIFNNSWSGSGGSSSGPSSSSSSSDRKGGGGGGGILPAILIALALIMIAWLLAVVLRFSLSRRREFLADAGSVELTKNPDAMISALRKIEGRGEIERANSAVMEMCIDNPRSGIYDLFATHPPVSKRVSALVEFAGGHDPGELADPDPADPETPGREPLNPPGPWGAVRSTVRRGSPWGALRS